MKISYAQRDVLKSLLDPQSYVRHRSCTNSTLSALEKRGLVTLKFVQHESIPNYRVPEWTITDAGRGAVSPAERQDAAS